MWEIGRRLEHNGDHPRPRVADRGTPLKVDKRVAPDREGVADKQCQGEGKLWSQYVIINREEGKGKPPRLFLKTGYPEPALQQKTEERERESVMGLQLSKMAPHIRATHSFFLHCHCQPTVVLITSFALTFHHQHRINSVITRMLQNIRSNLQQACRRFTSWFKTITQLVHVF